MSRRSRAKDLSTAELRVLARELLAHHEDGPTLAALARCLGVKLVECDDRRTTMRCETPPPGKKTPEEMTKLYEDQLLETHARTLGLRLYPDPRR